MYRFHKYLVAIWNAAVIPKVYFTFVYISCGLLCFHAISTHICWWHTGSLKYDDASGCHSHAAQWYTHRMWSWTLRNVHSRSSARTKHCCNSSKAYSSTSNPPSHLKESACCETEVNRLCKAPFVRSHLFHINSKKVFSMS